MSQGHGNTKAAWTAVAMALIGFLVGAIGLLPDPVNMTVFWVGVGITAASTAVFLVMSRLGLN